MNKYELALIVSAKIEDDARAAVVDRAKECADLFILFIAKLFSPEQVQ